MIGVALTETEEDRFPCSITDDGRQYQEKGGDTRKVRVRCISLMGEFTGHVHVRSHERFSDLMNLPEIQFLAITDVTIINAKSKTGPKINFLSLNKTLIIGIIPLDDNPAAANGKTN